MKEQLTMFGDQLASDIRYAHMKYQMTEETLRRQVDRLKEQCKHEHVVITRSYYKGSYSWDNDDWQAEARLCLVCGCMEGGYPGSPFNTLFNPIRRFEFSGSMYTTKINETPLGNVLLTPLEELLVWVKRNGYEVCRDESF
jgi:hypothetical protein